MWTLILKRLLAVIPTLFVVSVLVTALVQFVPGDPAAVVVGEDATVEELAEARERLGLDGSMLEQYLGWTGDALRGDLGRSVFTNRPVAESIRQRAPVTLSLAAGGLVFALVVGTPLGILAARRRGGALDRSIVAASTLGVSFPNYFLAMLLILPLAIWNPVFPASGYSPIEEGFLGWVHSIVLPSIALGSVTAATVTRQIRGAIIDELSQDYVRTARAKGLREPKVFLKHALKNAASPVVAILGVQVALMLGGAVIVEVIFGMHGIGSLVIGAANNGDIRIIQGVVLVSAVFVVLVNLATDVLAAYLTPQAAAT